MGIKGKIKNLVQDAIKLFGYELRGLKNYEFPVELSSDDRELVKHVLDSNISMVSVAGLCATLKAAVYVAENQIEGDFVECGVWRGGNALIAAEVFSRYKLDKKVYLFDTFAGMTEPSDDDRFISDNQPALKQFVVEERDGHNNWCYAPVEEVKANFKDKGLLGENIVFVKGPVEETLVLEENLPTQISILRLDTDWYESTKLELETLYPRVTSGGCLIIDDYGFWSGSKKATDEYFANHKPQPLLNVVDSGRRMAIKF
jgi:hypothetical protein